MESSLVTIKMKCLVENLWLEHIQNSDTMSDVSVGNRLDTKVKDIGYKLALSNWPAHSTCQTGRLTLTTITATVSEPYWYKLNYC